MTLILSGTNGLSDVDGSASTPAIRGTDSNTGIFFPAADTIAFAEGGAEVARFDSSGNLGIGTSSPGERLGVMSALTGTTAGSNVVARFQTNGNGYDAHIAMGDNVNASTRLGYLSGAMYFWTNGAERARITTAGFLLVGTTNSTGDGGGNEIRPNDGNGGLIVVKKTSSSVSGDQFMVFGRDGTTRGSIALNGTTAVSYNTTSDYRLKENIAPMTGALAKVALLKPCTYTWKSDGAPGQGFIAHELAEVVPDAVTGEKDAVDENGKIKPQAIDTSFLVATLTAAIQEQQALIKSLTARIAALEAA